MNVHVQTTSTIASIIATIYAYTKTIAHGLHQRTEEGGHCHR
jgi:hypothetical protein